MAIPGSVGLSPRAQDYYSRVFKPKYDALQARVSQTPLVLLVWGPGEAAPDLYQKRLQIRDELRRLGHDAFFSEELETSRPPSASATSPALSQTAIEFLQAEAVDLITVLQVSYGSVAEVHDFAELRVVNSKMLIFVDQAAMDGYSYRGALAELKALYNNVETYKYPEDIVQCNVLKRVLEKVNVLQIVKFRARESARAWGLIPAEEKSNEPT